MKCLLVNLNEKKYDLNEELRVVQQNSVDFFEEWRKIHNKETGKNFNVDITALSEQHGDVDIFSVCCKELSNHSDGVVYMDRIMTLRDNFNDSIESIIRQSRFKTIREYSHDGADRIDLSTAPVAYEKLYIQIKTDELNKFSDLIELRFCMVHRILGNSF